MADWTVDSWRKHSANQQPDYPDPLRLEHALDRVRAYPPLVAAGEVERLRKELAEAAAGRSFLLQGGDCAETLLDCTPDKIASKLKILLQMSLVITNATKAPVIRVGRLAGQYAKPRSSPFEQVDGQEIGSYRGDLVNDIEPLAEKRQPDPERLVQAYHHSALTLNFIRALIDGGFADLHHPEYWNLREFRSEKTRERYAQVVEAISGAVRFVEGMGLLGADVLTRVEFYTSHEGLHLAYEAAQTRTVPRRDGYYNLGAHMLWIGDRTRDLTGAHVEYFRGIRNPVGVKIGPSCSPGDAAELARKLNPDRDPGRLVFIGRFGAEAIGDAFVPILRAVQDSQVPVVWCCDPMHGNIVKTRTGQKTRPFEAILAELNSAVDIHEAEGSRLGGVHFELTGDDVTECIGGGSGLTEEDLERSYETFCDPRLNYTQSLEIAFLLGNKLGSQNR